MFGSRLVVGWLVMVWLKCSFGLFLLICCRFMLYFLVKFRVVWVGLLLVLKVVCSGGLFRLMVWLGCCMVSCLISMVRWCGVVQKCVVVQFRLVVLRFFLILLRKVLLRLLRVFGGSFLVFSLIRKFLVFIIWFFLVWLVFCYVIWGWLWGS